MGIIGNEKADKAAKSALSQDIFSFKIPYFDFKSLINVLFTIIGKMTGMIKLIINSTQ